MVEGALLRVWDDDVISSSGVHFASVDNDKYFTNRLKTCK